MKHSAFRCIVSGLVPIFLSACDARRQESAPEVHKIVVTSPQVKSVTVTEPYVCLIHSERHIQIRILEKGYLEEIQIKEGQTVKKGDVLFKVTPAMYEATLEYELANQDVAQMEYDFTKKLSDEKVVSDNETKLNKAKLARAHAKAQLASAQLNFATIKAPFDGIVDRLYAQQGSLVNEGDPLTTLSDNSVMWVYFNVPEAGYFEYMTESGRIKDDLKIELKLANGKLFPEPGKISAIEGDFNNKTGNIPFRADFPNPNRLLRHGQTGKILISRVQKDALVIPQRATFPILDKRYVYVVEKDNIVRQRQIEVQDELEDIFVIKSGVGVEDKLVYEGIRELRDGDKVEYEFRSPQQVMANLKFHAE